MLHHKNGSVLFCVIGLLTAGSVFLTLAWHIVTIERRKIQTIYQQENVCGLAKSCIALAIGQQKKDDKPQTIYANLFNTSLSAQTYECTQPNDPITARLIFRLQSEQGKLNINSLYDFDKKDFIKPEYEKALNYICKEIARITNTPSIFEALITFFKNRNYEINDLSELLVIPEITKTFEDKLFLPLIPDQGCIYLYDIFTVSTQHEGIDPWWLSWSLQTILGLERPAKMNVDELSSFTTKISGHLDSWNDKTWDACLADLYKKNYANLSQDIKSILTSPNKANIFSLLLKATMHDDSSTIYAIGQSSTKQHLIAFDIIKLYQV